MQLIALPDTFNLIGNEALIVMKADDMHQAVCVTKDALADVQAAPDPRWLPQDLSVLELIASRKFDHGEIAFDGRIWITAKDVQNWHKMTRH
ncbi:hypothetical protein AM571_PC01030 (plasmid) [Rhizobium etli 8C-3]|uniref:Uncharacterized protein n=2 Tax=Rhizobium TaxID=379 RepID=A0A4R3QQC2_9HYPH|nr:MULTISPECIES: hypothetical protein [Rhizobium]APO78766.1 hypothetical protein AM571_PC01030 [Rhizobium etli 8C-3]TCU24443.1 hypothetical protein EV130_10634 [Rhizobium azibense]TCU39189.1 hypothetical protein EV129_10334 [Rhizobium azibense]